MRELRIFLLPGVRLRSGLARDWTEESSPAVPLVLGGTTSIAFRRKSDRKLRIFYSIWQSRMLQKKRKKSEIVAKKSPLPLKIVAFGTFLLKIVAIVAQPRK